MDIETGKTVAEWGFQKDGIDVDMKDLVNDTKGMRQLQRNAQALWKFKQVFLTHSLI